MKAGTHIQRPSRCWSRPALSATALLAAAVVFTAGASATVLSDDFDDNTRGDIWHQLEWSPSKEWVDETHQRLEVRAAPDSDDECAYYVLRKRRLDTNYDFAMQVDWHFTKLGSGDSWIELGLGRDGAAVIGIEVGSEDSSRYQGVWGDTNGVEDVDDYAGRTDDTGTFYISYDSGNDRLYFSMNDYWINEHDPEDGNWVYDGKVRGQWGADQMFVFIGGGAEDTAVASGEAYFDDFIILEGELVTPATQQIAIASSPNTNVQIEVRPEDNNDEGNGSTSFTRTYDVDIPAFLTAPADDGHGNPFTLWRMDGINWSTYRSVEMVADMDHTVTAVYGGAGLILSDDFDDNTRGDIWYQIEWDPDTIWVEETSQRLELRSTVDSDEEALYVLRKRRLDTNYDFAMQVDWHFTKLGSGDSWIELGLGRDGAAVIGIEVGSEDSSRYQGVWGDTNGVEDVDDYAGRTDDTGTFYISYDSGNDRLYFSMNDYWINEHDPEDGNWVYDGKVRGQWGADQMFVFIGGGAEDTAVASGEAYFDDFMIIAGQLVTPATQEITVSSSPNTNVAIEVRPEDNSDQGNGNTNFTRTYDVDIPVFLTAPADDGHGNAFALWQMDGRNWSTYDSVEMVADMGHTLTAVYGDPGPLLSDDFNDNTRGDIWYQIEQNPATVWVEEAHQRLDVLATSDSDDEMAFYASREWRLSTYDDFAYQVGWQHSRTGSGESGVMLGVALDTANSVIVGAGSADNIPYFFVGGETDGVVFLEEGTFRSVNDGTLYVSYDSDNDRLHLSVNGYWRPSNPTGGDWVVEDVVDDEWDAGMVLAYLGGGASGAGLATGDAYLDNFEVTQGTVVVPPTQQLTISSSPSPNVPIQVRPEDNNDQDDGNTPFTRSYDIGTPVCLTAPATASGGTFSGWLKNGNPHSADLELLIIADSDDEYTAVYVRKGDFDVDGDVDFMDFMEFVDVHGLHQGDPGWLPNGPTGDFDDDNDVDQDDFGEFVNAYGT